MSLTKRLAVIAVSLMSLSAVGMMSPIPAMADDPAAATDPVGDYCANGGEREQLFDCPCIAGKAGELRAALAEASAGKYARQIQRSQDRIEAFEADAAEDPGRAAAYEKKIEFERSKIDKLANPDPMSFGNGMIMKQFDEMPDCRSREGAYQSSHEACMSTSDEGEAYCGCVADKVADAWTGQDVISSSALRNVSVRARMACSQ